MDAAILANHLQKALHVGGVQLLVGAVLQNVLHQRVIPQAFQCFGIRGPAALGLFAVGQAHGVKQHFAQLLGAVGVEAGAAGLHVDAGEHLLQLGAQLHTELLDAVFVHQHTGAGHIGQHLCQRELDLVVKGVLTAGGDLGLHLAEQVCKAACIRVIGTGKGSSGAVAGGQLADLILGSRSVQQVGGKLAIPHDAAAPAACGHGLGIEGRCVEHFQRYVCVVQQAHKVCILQRVNGAVLHGVPALRLQHHVAGALLAHHGRARCHQIGAGRSQRQSFQLCFSQLDAVLFFRGGRCNAVQPKARDQRVDLQFLQKAHGLGFVALAHGIGALGRVDGGIGADGAKGVAQLGHLAAFQQMFPLFGLDELIVDVLVHAFQRAKVLHKGQGGLFTNALHARNIIRSIAHQALHLNELSGLDAVFFLNGVHVHRHRLAASHDSGGKQHSGGVTDQLQAVPVSRSKEAVVLSGGAGSGQRAKNIIRFPAFGGDGAVAEVCQKFLEHRHLLGQLFGHAMAGGLVAIVHFVAEGGSLQVKGNSHLVGFALLEQGEQDIQKAIDGGWQCCCRQ